MPLGSFTDAAGVPRCIQGVCQVDSTGAPTAISADGEIFTTNTERETNARIALSGLTSSISTAYYGLIDLSDTTNWPHAHTGRIDFSYLALLVDKASAARGALSLGVITRVSTSDADVTWVAAASFTQNDTASVEIIANLAPSQLKCGVVGGSTPRIKTNNKSLALTAINTATPLAFGPGGATFIPAVGDIVVRVATTANGDVSWGFSAFYHSHEAP